MCLIVLIEKLKCLVVFKIFFFFFFSNLLSLQLTISVCSKWFKNLNTGHNHRVATTNDWWIWQCLKFLSLTDLQSFCENLCNTNENNQKMLLPFSYNDRVCQKTDVLARGTKMYNLTIPKDWLLILAAGHSNLDLLWEFLSFKNSLIYIRKKKLKEGKKRK